MKGDKNMIGLIVGIIIGAVLMYKFKDKVDELILKYLKK